MGEVVVGCHSQNRFLVLMHSISSFSHSCCFFNRSGIEERPCPITSRLISPGYATGRSQFLHGTAGVVFAGALTFRQEVRRSASGPKMRDGRRGRERACLFVMRDRCPRRDGQCTARTTLSQGRLKRRVEKISAGLHQARLPRFALVGSPSLPCHHFHRHTTRRLLPSHSPQTTHFPVHHLI